MGLIRLLLAISVLLAHCGPIFGITLIKADNAVELFYIISGFYMALILNEKYLNKPYGLFISNRILRLYPIYFVIFVLSLVFCLLSGLLFNNMSRLEYYAAHYDNIKAINLILIFITNITIVGQDWLLYLGVNPKTGNLFLTSNFNNTDPQLYNFIFVPQAWTIALEMYFYLIAPFIVRKKVHYLLALMGFSLGLRLLFYNYGLYNDPWTYRFFPFELFYFMAGAICYKIYQKTKVVTLPVSLNYAIISYIVTLIICYKYLPSYYLINVLICYISFFICMPIIFNFTKYSRIDRIIGELSYPVYIIHILIVTILRKYITTKYLGLSVTIVSIVASYILIKTIAEPIERFRQSRVNYDKKNS